MSDDRNVNDRRGPEQERGGFGHGRGRGLTTPTEKARDFRGTVRRLASYLAPQKWTFIAVLILAVFGTMFSIVSPRILGRATDSIYDSVKLRLSGNEVAFDYGYIGNLLLLLIGLYLISALFQYVMGYIMASVSQRTVYDMRQALNDKFAKLPLKYYDGRTHGEVLSRVTNDMDNIANTLQQSITQFITAVVTILGAIVMMLSISPLLTLIAMTTLPMSVGIIRFVTSRSQKHFTKQQKVLGELNGHIEEMITGHKEVKVFNREEKSMEKFADINNELFESGYRAQFISGIIMPMMNFINNFGYVLIAVAGGLMVAGGSISLGSIQAFFNYSRQFGHPIVQTAQIANMFQSTIASAERVFEVLDEVEEVDEPQRPKTLDEPLGEVVFDHVRFGYEDDNILMKDMNIHVRPGQMVAIVGPTGAGKTTLVNLLMRFYEIQGGAILVDGIDTRDMERSSLRKNFGMVLQDTWLFNGTIMDNIAYGCDNASETDVRRAAKAAHADHFIRTLPEGYDTVLNEEASNISQGQKQLLTIARAILANAPILILDEATSSVDTRTEIQIQKAMDNMMAGRTSFVIAHRLSTIKDADLILVMKDGDIIETGNHDSLLSQEGFYADLYNAQFAGFEEMAI